MARQGGTLWVRMGVARTVFSRAFTEHAPARRISAVSYYRWLVIGTVCIGAFLGQLDASIATLVLPTLEQVFHASTAAVEWVAIAYLLTLAALVVIFGRLADMAGRKLLYNAGFLVFILGSGLCGLSHGLGELIVFRVLQAVGAAMLQSNSVAIITAAIPRRELGRAIGVQGAAQAVGLSIGPSVGGFLIGALGWEWVFYISVPFGLLGTLVAWFVLPQTARSAGPEASERFDWGGAVSLTVAIGLALLALTFGTSWGWTSPRLLAVAALSAAALTGFCWLERRVAWPLVDFQLFRSRVFSAGIASGLFSYAVLFGALFVLPFYLQRVLRHSAASTGLLLTVVPLAIAVLAPVSGLLADRRGARLPTVLGMSLAAAALLALTFAGGRSTAVLVVLFAVFGVGLGFFTPANNSAIMGSAPANRLGVAGGVLNMTRSLGTSLGVAATGAVLALAIGGSFDNTIAVPPAALLRGFGHALVFLAILSVLAGAISSLRGRRSPATRARRSIEAQAESVAL